MKKRRTPRAERLLDLVSFLLATDRPVEWTEIREAFPADYLEGAEQSCLRKFERDKAELLDLGIPMEWVASEEGSRGGYRIDKGRYYLPDLDLTPRERTLLSVAGAAALQQGAFPFRDDLVRALGKLSFPHPGLRASLLPAERAFAEDGLLDLLGRAVATRADVSIAYRSYGGMRTERILSPYGLAFRNGAWFLVGHCHLRQGVRTFSVERILSAEEVGGEGAFPVPEGFDLRTHVGREPWELDLHPAREVELLIGPGAIPLARNLFGPASIREMEDGLRILLRVTNDEAILRLALRMAPHAEVLAPADLRERVREAARSIASRHAGVPAPTPAPLQPAAQGAGEKRRPQRDLRETIQRALLLIPHAVAMSGCTVRELADAVGLDEEALLGEIDFLRLVGRPPFSPADLVDLDVVGGRVVATLPQGFDKPPALTPLEGAALDAAASALIAEGGEALREVREKIRQAIPPGARERFDDIAGRFHVAAWSLRQETARLIDRAIEERRELALQYFSATRGETSRRTLWPLRRFLHQGYWYLYAFCKERRDRRLFRLDRATDLRLGEKTFLPRSVGETAPGGPAAAVQAWVRVLAGPRSEQGFLFRLGAREIQQLEDGSVIAAFPMQEEAYVLSSVLSLAAEGEAVEPLALRRRVEEEALRVADLHAERS